MNSIETAVALAPESDPGLRAVAAEVTNIREQVLPYINAMRDLMNEKNGVGLAAPQVGISLRFFVSKIEGCRVVINPTIVELSGGRKSRPEGCLTWPGQFRRKSRHQVVTFDWTDRYGVRKRSTREGFEARIFQHECDHLDGVCLF